MIEAKLFVKVANVTMKIVGMTTAAVKVMPSSYSEGTAVVSISSIDYNG